MTTEERDEIKKKYHEALVSDALEMLNGPHLMGLELSLRNSLQNYLCDRLETGGFLRACLENDFVRAVALAHPCLMLGQLKLVQQLLLGGFPSCAWGSRKAVQDWLDNDYWLKSLAGDSK